MRGDGPQGTTCSLIHKGPVKINSTRALEVLRTINSIIICAYATIIFGSTSGAAFFQPFGTNKVCKLGVIQKFCDVGNCNHAAKSLGVCKQRCAAISTCTYLAYWDKTPRKECRLFSGKVCTTRELWDHGHNQLFKRTFGSAFSPKTRAELQNAVGRMHSMSTQSDCPDGRKSTSSDSASTSLIGLDPFCHRQFDDPQNKRPGEKIAMSTDDFMDKILEEVSRLGGSKAFVDGYAPFCKHVFIPNFTDLRTSTVRITSENAQMIASEYDQRTPEELPVLMRFIDKKKYGELPTAKYLDLILYSREQIIKENQAMGQPPPTYDSPWGLISVKAQDVSYEQPMNPITMMRNALGKSEGGSGVPLNREQYDLSVKFWSEHVNVR